MHPERQFSSAQAHNLWREAVREAGLVGEAATLYADTTPYTAVCTLYYPDGRRIATASGKGRHAEQAKLSAAYEALEHACSFVARHHVGMDCLILSLNNFRERGLQSLENFYQPDFFEQIDPDFPITWLAFRSIHGEQLAYLPWALFNPVYLESDDNPDQLLSENMEFLSTGSGIAIGACFEEAFMHALSEVVERDATSTYLKQTFLQDQAPNSVQFETLPKHLQSLYLELAELSARPVLITRLSVRIAGFYAYQVRLLNTDYLCGYGCSIESSYALERALLECKEAYDLTRAGTIAADYQPILHHEILLKCAKNDLSQFAKTNAFQAEAFVKNEFASDFSVRYQRLLELCREHSQAIYVHRFRQFKNGVAIVIVFVPGMSYFFAVQKGYPFDLTRNGTWL